MSGDPVIREGMKHAAMLHDANTLLKDVDAKVGKEQIKKMAEELVRRGVDPAELGRVSRMKMYQAVTKDEAGNAHVHDLWGFHLDPTWETGPSWPVIQQAPRVRLTKRTTPKVKRDTTWRKCVVAPDIQAGYLRVGEGVFEPTHDPVAIELFLQMLEHVQPEVVILLGDNLDLPAFGKYQQHPSFQLTTQLTLNYMHTLLARIRDICGPATEIVWLEGNHEKRLPNYIIDNAKAAFGIKRANTPKSWPVLSVPHLLWMDELDVTYLSGYPANHYWLTPKLRFIHGHSVKSKGSTAHLYLNDEKVSVVYGHIHRREWAEQTRVDYDGIATILAASPGTLARVDGAVPSVGQGFDVDGRPVMNAENWQQGIAVVDYDIESGFFDYNQVPIHTEPGYDGAIAKWCRYETHHFTATGSYQMTPDPAA